MPEERTHASKEADGLDELFVEYLEADESGKLKDSRDLAERYPELADAVAAHKGLGRLVAPLRELATTAGFPSDETQTLPTGTVIGDYKLLEVIDQGGMGIVYKARSRVFKEMVVALKMIASGSRPTEEQRQRFLGEVENQAKLDHPRIVSVTGGGEHNGHLYFTMRLIEGGDLRKFAANQPVPTREAAQLVIKIARAVHHAHQRNILHRDLKPSNVLLDAEGEPYVADFGLARQLTREDLPDHRYMVGAPAFAAPEQIDGQGTVLSDVYGLGTILYWLLTGGQPFKGDTIGETLRKVREEQPEPPRMLNPQLNKGINRYVDSICLKCLEKAPERRYQSADAIAVDLERWLNGNPPLGVAVRRRDRFRFWCGRNPLFAALMLIAATALLLVIGMSISVSRARVAHLEEDILKANAYAARLAAGMMLGQFREWAETAYGVSKEAERFLEQDDREGLKQFLEQSIRDTNGSRIEVWIVLTGEGVFAVGSHPPKDTQKYDFRDYFRGALKQADQAGVDSVYVSRAYRSSYDDKYRIPFARALRNTTQPDELWVIAGFIFTDATMGLPLHDGRRTAALIAPEDPNADARIPLRDETEQHLIMAHEGYEYGQDPIPMPSEALGIPPKLHSAKQLSPADAQAWDPRQQMNANYRDPIGDRLPQYAGRWLAVFAPVGNTGYLVVVQQRYDDAIGPDEALTRQLFLWGGSALCLVVILVGAIVGTRLPSQTRTLRS